MSHPGVCQHVRLLLLFGAVACGTPRSAAVPAQDARPPTPLAQGDPQGDALAPFFGEQSYDGEITTPDEWLGRPVGTRLASHDEVTALWKRWAEQSPRVVLRGYGSTHEGRELFVGILTSAANQARLDRITADQGRLAAPRGLAAGELDGLLESTPAVAFLGCSIHGDETSGVDGGLALAHHLIAGQGAQVERLLEQVVVVIDPCMNPDGRERFRAMVLQNSGRVPSLDSDSLSRGRWPWGRGNHFLFDMNRDWMAGITPETRGRWSVLTGLMPQLFVDAHEMSPLDTFLFYPQAAPHNPELPDRLGHWQRVFAARQSEAFDAHGWSYYTREWADAWGPFYSDSWGSLNGAIGMLYEQARFGGQPLLRGSGEVATYREAVWHQAVAGLASIEALAENRREVLRDFSAHRAANLSDTTACVIRPGRQPGREAWLADTLESQGVRVMRTRRALELGPARGALGERVERLSVPAGSLVVPAGQPSGALVRAFLEFDVRIDDETLLEERRSLERKERSKMYDVTSWSLVHALALDGWWSEAPDAIDLQPWEPAPVRAGAVGAGGYGWVVDGDQDAALAFAVRALESGLALHAADEPFSSAGREFARGSLLVRRHENGADVEARVDAAARAAGVEALATASARAPGEGHDLGGGHFRLLERPRVALLAGSLTEPSGFGHLWHYLDSDLGLAVSLLEATELAGYDLRRFNVLIVPPGSQQLGALLAPHAEALRTWVASGGTLVAVGSSAALLADEQLDLSRVRRRADALADLAVYEELAQRERDARDVHVDSASLWEGAQDDGAGAAEGELDLDDLDDGFPDEQALEREDRWRRRFMPMGATLRGEVDDQAWITAGAGDALPVLSLGDSVLLAPEGVRSAVRLAPAERLRIAGLVWPEARARLAHGAWLTVERRGHGQVVLFAAPPVFRGYQRGTARLFGNAVVLGAGLGAQAPRPR